MTKDWELFKEEFKDYFIKQKAQIELMQRCEQVRKEVWKKNHRRFK